MQLREITDLKVTDLWKEFKENFWVVGKDRGLQGGETKGKRDWKVQG